MPLHSDSIRGLGPRLLEGVFDHPSCSLQCVAAFTLFGGSGFGFLWFELSWDGLSYSEMSLYQEPENGRFFRVKVGVRVYGV